MRTQNILAEKYGMSRELADTITESGRVCRLNKGNFLYLQGDLYEYIVFPLKGTLGFQLADSRHADVFYNLITPGILMNEIQFLLGGHTVLHLRASAESIVLTLPYKAAEKLMAESPEFSRMLSLSMAKKQRAVSHLFHLSSERTADKRVFKALEMIDSLGKDTVLPVNIVSLSSLLNMSRNTVAKAIDALVFSGVLIKEPPGYRVIPVTG